MTPIEAVIVAKSGGPLTKKLWLGSDGRLLADSSQCGMTNGGAKRWVCHSVHELAEAIAGFKECNALTIGTLAPSLPEKVRITTARRLNGAAKPDLITRTIGNFCFRDGVPALALLDFDTKDMPADVAARIAAAGGFWPALVAVAPGLEWTGRVERASTSAGLYRSDTGEQLPGSIGCHVYLTVHDGADIERFLKTLHARCWLAGMGWMRLGEAGQLLERSIVDCSVGSPERLVFEGPPQLIDPLCQAPRLPIAHDGGLLDTLTACLPLSALEETRLGQLRAAERARLKPEAARVRRAYVETTAARLGVSEQIIERRCLGILRPETVLEFDDAELAGVTVADVLHDPDKYIGETLADPIEGVGYGRGKAKILRRGDSVIVHSFAHGLSTVFRLVHDAAAIEALVRAAKPADAGRVFIRGVVAGDVDEIELDYLIGLTVDIAKCTKTALRKELKAARAARSSETRAPRPARTESEGVMLEDFFAYMPKHNYIFMPSREAWPASSVDSRIPPIPVGVGDDAIPASMWLDQHRPVEQMTWTPGEPMLIESRLIAEGGWIHRKGVRCLNLYRPPIIEPGDPQNVRHWTNHVQLVYPNDWLHIIRWLAQRVQRPAEKINHALVLGGDQGIGKDTLLEPVKRAVGPWNCSEPSPSQVMGRFNGFLKAVLMRISECRDLSESDRYKFYDHTKVYIAAPPDVLRVDEKNLPEHSVVNCCGAIITTNYKENGLYLPADDRRHYVAWSDKKKEQFRAAYWDRLWRWYESGGDRNVAAYLAALDISGFNPKAPPPKTEAFWAIVDANHAPEDAEIADVLDDLERPKILLVLDIIEQARVRNDFALVEHLSDRKNARRISHRMAQAGYSPVRNPSADDGRWKIAGRRRVIYGRKGVPSDEAVRLAKEVAEGAAPAPSAEDDLPM